MCTRHTSYPILERNVVYWYSFSNPCTLCIHCGFSLVGNNLNNIRNTPGSFSDPLLAVFYGASAPAATHIPTPLDPYSPGWGELAVFRVACSASPASLLSHTLFLATSVFLPISYSTPRRPPHTLPLLSVPYRDTGATSSMYTPYVHSPDSLFVINELHKDTHKPTHPWN